MRRITLLALLTFALAFLPASRAIAQTKLSSEALLGAIYSNSSSDKEVPPYSFRDILPDQASQVCFFVVTERHLLEPLQPYLRRRHRALTLLGLVGDKQDFPDLMTEMIREYGDVDKPSSDIASIDYYFEAFGYLMQRRVQGAAEFNESLETEAFWKRLNWPMGNRTANERQAWRQEKRVQLMLKFHMYGETGWLQETLDKYLPTLDSETRDKYDKRWGDPDYVFEFRMQMRRVPQLPYSDDLNAKYEAVYKKLPANVRAEFEKQLAEWEKEDRAKQNAHTEER